MRRTRWGCQGRAWHFVGSGGSVGDSGGEGSSWCGCWRAAHSLNGFRMWEESGSGWGGGRGKMMIDVGGVPDGGLVNFCPGRGAPSLQVNLVILRGQTVKAAAKVGEGVGGAGHSIEVTGKQSQSILASI
jgi:hypothetical protein